jgi:tRNA pseudouridine38-40 synthase
VEQNSLQEAARCLPGTHDYGAFGTPAQSGGHTFRVVLQADWTAEPPYFVFEIIAQAFLYHMARRLVFMQVAIAQGKLSTSDLDQALTTGEDLRFRDGREVDSHDRLVHGLAPAQGLILAEVNYPPEALGFVEDNKTK